MEKILKQLQREPNTVINKWLVFIVVLVAIIWSGSTIDFAAGAGNGAVIARNIFLGIVQPDTELLFDWSNGVPFLILETLAIAFVGTLVGSIIAIPFAFLSSKNVVGKVVSYITSLMIMAIRTVPVFVYGLMFIRVTGPGPFAGVLTMAIASLGMMSKLFAEAIEELDGGILESLDAAGCNRFEKIRYGIIPQLIPDFISTVIYRFDMNIRDVAVLGLVGAGGIGAPLIFAMNSHRWNEAGSILIGLVILVLIIEYFSTKVRNKLTRG